MTPAFESKALDSVKSSRFAAKRCNATSAFCTAMTIHPLYQRLFRQNEFAIKLGLDNIGAAIELIGAPHRRCPHLLIAGTNGKGSTAAILHNIVRLSGLRTGLFTSPHLVHLRERFRIDALPVEEAQLLPLVQESLDAFSGQGEWPQAWGEMPGARPTLTFFELATVMALRLFEQAQTEFDIYEVGLGGRLDATNALDPSLSVITSIGIDHQQWLGEDLGSIAREKAGIMRSGREVVISSRSAQKELLQEAVKRSAHALCIGRDFEVDEGLVFHGLGRSISLPALEDRPRNWRDNAAGAVAAALRMAQGGSLPPLTAERLNHAIATTHWPGRFWRAPRAATVAFCQRQDVPELLLDAAHNPASFASLLNEIEDRWPGRRVHLLYASMADKDIAKIGEQLESWKPLVSLSLSGLPYPRAESAQRLRQLIGFEPSQAFDAPSEALSSVLSAARVQDLVVVAGSIYLLGEVIRLLGCEAAVCNSVQAPTGQAST